MDLTEGAGQLLDLGLELGLAAAGPAGAPGQGLTATEHELIAPGRDRGVRDAFTSGRLLDRDLTAQHGEDDPQLLVDRLDGWSSQQDSFNNRPGQVSPVSRILTQDTGQAERIDMGA